MQINDIVKGLPVRLVLGATIDTQLGVRARPRRFIADENAREGRRAVPADVDDDGNERAQPIAKVIGIQRRGRGQNLVEIEFADLARGEIDAELLEQAGDPPAADEQPSGDARGPRHIDGDTLAHAVEEGVARAAGPLVARIDRLERDNAQQGTQIAALERALRDLEERVSNAARDAAAVKNAAEQLALAGEDAARAGAALEERVQKLEAKG